MKPKEKLIRLTEIIDKVVDASTVLDEQTRVGLKGLSLYARNVIARTPKLNASQVKTLTNELLSYWNRNIRVEIENFWTELMNNDIHLERFNPLRFALEKKRFSSVELGIDARNNWDELKKADSLQSAFSPEEIAQIDEIIANDEKKRLALLKKCLRKKEIPKSQYLKFGESMAYFVNCHLFEKYFTEEEVKELYELWKNH